MVKSKCLAFGPEKRPAFDKDEKIDQLNAERQRMWELRRGAQAEAGKCSENLNGQKDLKKALKGEGKRSIIYSTKPAPFRFRVNFGSVVCQLNMDPYARER